MEFAILDRPFSLQSCSYAPADFKVPCYETLIRDHGRFLVKGIDEALVAELLGLQEGSHLTRTMEDLISDGEQDRDHLKPLQAAPAGEGSLCVENVRSYGRGYVVPNIARDGGGGYDLAVKGAGASGWVLENMSYVERENANRGLVIGRQTDQVTVKELLGEHWTTPLGIKQPKLAYVADCGQGYCIGRLWRSPERLWELTSTPFRVGPDAAQAIVLLTWGVELRHALAHRGAIRERAQSCFARAIDGQTNGERIAAFDRTLINTIASITGADLQLGPWIFHLANVSYSGETSGFDRIIGPYARYTNNVFFLSALGSIIELWAASNWLRAILGLELNGFVDWFDACREEMKRIAPESRISKAFNAKSTVERIYDGISTRISNPRHVGLFFARRHKGDIASFCNAIYTFQSGLKKIFAGEINSWDELARWEDSIDMAAVERVRLKQTVSGQYAFELSYKYAERLRSYEQLIKGFVPLFEEREIPPCPSWP